MDDVIAVVTDLFFQSRIGSSAKAAGRQVRYVSRITELGSGGYRLALVDMDAQTDVEGLIRALKALPGGTVVAFGPHLDTEKRKAARLAGADRVLAKSKFVTELPKMMQDQFPTGLSVRLE
jgi:hypothetical protein